MSNHYESLNKVSIKDKIEKKGGLDYLSWANAWNELHLLHPSARRIVYESPATGLNYFTDGKTGYVKVGIVVDGLEHIDYLPIMDFRNNSIPLEKITSQDVNKTIQRSTAKAIAMHGLGIQLWIGEDTRDEKPVPASAPSSSTIQLMAGDTNYEKVVSYISKNNESMTFEQILANLRKKYAMTDMLIKKLNLVYDGETTK